MKEDSTRPLVCVVDDDVSVRESVAAAVKHATAPPAARVPGMASRNRRILGASEALRRMLHQVELVADTDATVLITGETGTGKELVARAIHERSRRAPRAAGQRSTAARSPRPSSRASCSGTSRARSPARCGTGRGASSSRTAGRCSSTRSASCRWRCSRSCCGRSRRREVERVGETTPAQVDVRIVAATNRDLRAEVEAGRFRADLYYRLNVFPIRNPSLRERREDIPLLAWHFVAEAARRLGCAAPAVNDAALRQLADRDWPGNVRELENAVERAVILASGGPIRFEAADVDVAWSRRSCRPPRRPPSRAVPC